MTKYQEVPIAIENQLREIIKDDEKYKIIEEELKNTPYGVSPTFFDLYEE